MAAKLIVNGNVTASGTLDVSGDTTLTSDVSLPGALHVTGDTTLSADVDANSDYGSATQIYGVRAYLNYDHDADSIMGSAGVSSVNDTATGRFTINWSFTWPDDNYSLVLTSAGPSGTEGDDSCATGATADWSTTSAATRWKNFTSGTSYDSENCNAIAVR